MRLSCYEECHIPEGYLEKERERIDVALRRAFIERIDHRSILLGFGSDIERATRMFEEQILDAGMTSDEAKEVMSQMHETNIRMMSRGRKA